MTRPLRPRACPGAAVLGASLAMLALLSSCASAPALGDRLPRTGEEIVVCGQLFHIGTPVVLWTDPGGYDGYRARRTLSEPKEGEPAEKQRYGTRTTADAALAARVAQRGWTLADLQQTVRQFVLHYDVCGTSRKCHKVLEMRGLSVHFMLDVDGTIYQTLDLKERAWHASQANSTAVGVEIAHIGAYPQPRYHTLDAWYPEDEEGRYVNFVGFTDDPAQESPLQTWTGIRTPGFVARPARAELQSGPIHGKVRYQYDYTEEQYRALIRLVAGLHAALPRIAIDAPRDVDGQVLTRALSDAELAGFDGVIGHYHVTENKTDPGPALDWERVLGEARQLAP